ncbi:MAG TPA: hypothetical protein VIJ34_05505 [Acidimicrobiales bacterium]
MPHLLGLCRALQDLPGEGSLALTDLEDPKQLVEGHVRVPTGAEYHVRLPFCAFLAKLVVAACMSQ